jgi:hypothetical protein
MRKNDFGIEPLPLAVAVVVLLAVTATMATKSVNFVRDLAMWDLELPINLARHPSTLGA